ncbi:hypothetical protein [Bulleidia sp. zg-1006]|uniref:hypothetical protein n=1 Tax=Bulleidia sp. zg-1006 TaxID=2806552 RepID=UPI00193A8660|nr:hypothetical protein [Bulleidia sp. zg-1006]QRG86075.1 hypothetical protein JOS54_04160 [Bulleidia sp. zg-1006]
MKLLSDNDILFIQELIRKYDIQSLESLFEYIQYFMQNEKNKQRFSYYFGKYLLNKVKRLDQEDWLIIFEQSKRLERAYDG